MTDGSWSGKQSVTKMVSPDRLSLIVSVRGEHSVTKIVGGDQLIPSFIRTGVEM